MPTAYKGRSMSQILGHAAGDTSGAKTGEPAATPEEQKPAIPEKYQGKTIEDVIEMHRNAESRLGSMANEVGSLRGLVSDLSSIQRPPVKSEPAEQETVDVSGDDVLADPVSAVRKIVKQDFDKLETKSRQREADELVRLENEALLSKWADVDAIVTSPEFIEFTQRTDSRKQDLETAARGEGIQQVRAARRLLEDFDDFNAAARPDVTQTPAQKAVTAAKKVATEGSHTGAPISTKPSIHESDVIALIQSDPAKYRSPSYQRELLSAIKEGRFVKN